MKRLEWLPWRQHETRPVVPVRPAMQVGIGGMIGAGLMYLFDAANGRRRRHVARDRALASLRRTGERLEGYGRLTGATAYGLVQRIAHAPGAERPAVSDEALADRVRSEAFRDRDLSAGQVNVNVEEGAVVLRGQLDRPEQIREVEAAVRAVEGVDEVKSYLHLPHTPAPNKQDALGAT
jgi:hypothetical protein